MPENRNQDDGKVNTSEFPDVNFSNGKFTHHSHEQYRKHSDLLSESSLHENSSKHSHKVTKDQY